MKSLRPAFVITLAALAPLACQNRTRTSNPPPPNTGSGASTDPGNGGESSKRRAVRNPVPKYQQFDGQIDWMKVKHLSPRDSKNNLIMAAQDGSCFISVPENPDGPIGPPGTGLKSVSVDCPAAMQDPAYDTCLGGELIEASPDQCACVQTGNPPPPTAKAECPKR